MAFRLATGAWTPDLYTANLTGQPVASCTSGSQVTPVPASDA